MWPLENNIQSVHSDQPLKNKNNFVMEQYLARKCRINLNKPIYIGIIILDLSKILI